MIICTFRRHLYIVLMFIINKSHVLLLALSWTRGSVPITLKVFALSLDSLKILKPEGFQSICHQFFGCIQKNSFLIWKCCFLYKLQTFFHRDKRIQILKKLSHSRWNYEKVTIINEYLNNLKPKISCFNCHNHIHLVSSFVSQNFSLN